MTLVHKMHGSKNVGSAAIIGFTTCYVTVEHLFVRTVAKPNDGNITEPEILLISELKTRTIHKLY